MGFMNNFSEICEQKLSCVSAKLTELEIVLVVLEEKLNSIPDCAAAGPQSVENIELPPPE